MPITQFYRVGKSLEKRLAQLGIQTAQDVLFHFPFRYEDYRSVVPIKEVLPGVDLTIKGTIELIANKRSPRKRTMITEAVVRDDTEQIRVIWFGQPFIAKVLHVGDVVYLSGSVKEDMFGTHMVGPAYEKVREDRTTMHTARIVPMYPLTAGVTQKQMRFLVEQVVPLVVHIREWIPESILQENHLITLTDALKGIHFPENHEERIQAERRLKFGELFVLQLRAELIRQSNALHKAPHIEFKETEIRELVHSIPFELTPDQKKSAWEIFQDMAREHPMNRLLQGDVGSGKTVVAGMAAYLAHLNGFQSVIMAPTEILATQHYETLTALFGDRISMGLLSGSQVQSSPPKADPPLVGNKKSKEIQKGEIKKLISEGEVDLIIGTHALLTEDTQFSKLGIVIIDEQHRFGVGQRKTIRDKSGMEGMYPHFLSMTATPIPRSYALTLYGDLDVSYIKMKPKGRKDIITRLVEPSKRERAYQFIREQVQTGRQIFVVCPLIEEGAGNTGEKKTVLSEYEKLSTKIFPDLRVGYLHGKMKSKEKEVIMKTFASGEIDILVSTSVIEVGVNIPNASIMMIEGAERFGLAQLHQFRGRVGRSEHQSYCILFTEVENEKSKERLEYFTKTLDGFALAEYDLEMRGPGEVYGTSQSGMEELRLATMRDQDIIKAARESARDIDFKKFPALLERVKEWEDQVHME